MKIIQSVNDYYVKKFFSSGKPKKYLKQRGLSGPALFEIYGLGYSDGLLLSVLSKKQIAELITINILDKNKTEYFKGCITIPLKNSAGMVTGFIGKDIKTEKVKLFGSGIFNRKASKTDNEIIITKNIINALLLIQAGITNVQFSFNDLTEEHLLLLKQDRVKTIVLTYNSEKQNKKILSFGFALKTINIKDYKNIDKEKIKKKIESIKGEVPEQPDFTVFKQDSSLWFKIKDITYRVTGVKKVFVSSLKVAIKTEYKDKKFFDTIDLYSFKGRENYSKRVSIVLNAEPEIIEKDLNNILDYLEKERDKNLKTENIDYKDTMNADSKKTGEAFLKSKNIFKEIEDDMTKLGYVSESYNKLACYLAATSRFFSSPLDIYIQADSAGGKSALLNTLEKIFMAGDSIRSRLIKFIIRLLKEFKKDKCFIRASSLSYTSLLALIPLTALIFSLFAAFDAFSGVIESIQRSIVNFLVY